MPLTTRPKEKPKAGKPSPTIRVHIPEGGVMPSKDPTKRGGYMDRSREMRKRKQQA